MEKYLIINADDFGMCRAANLATFDLFKYGGISCATIMAPCSWAPEAVQFARDNPQYCVGVHLTFTSEWSKYRWSPVAASNTETLRDKDGYMHKSCKAFEKSAHLEQVRAEIIAQIERLKSLGLSPSHLDNHMGSLYGMETGRVEVLKLTLDIAAEYKLPYRFPIKISEKQIETNELGFNEDTNIEAIQKEFAKIAEYAKGKGVPLVDYLFQNSFPKNQVESYENYRDYMYERLKSYPNGISEIYIHPSLESDELKGTSSVWHRRVWEHRLFSDPATKQYLRDCKIKLINYRDLAEMRKS